MVGLEVSWSRPAPPGGAGRAATPRLAKPTRPGHHSYRRGATPTLGCAIAVPGKPPERIVPLLYLGTAHVALVLACILTGLWPQAVAGFLYHAWLILIVHLVTLGWITFSILGAIYIVGPLALRMDMPARKADYVAYACAVIGLIGMVGHFWIQEYGGMAWSAATIAGGVFFMTAPHRDCHQAGGHATSGQVAPDPGVRELLVRGIDGRPHRLRQGRALPAGVRPVECLRARPSGRARLGHDDGRRRRVPDAADDVPLEDAVRPVDLRQCDLARNRRAWPVHNALAGQPLDARIRPGDRCGARGVRRSRHVDAAASASQGRSEHAGRISRYFMPPAPVHHSSLRQRSA